MTSSARISCWAALALLFSPLLCYAGVHPGPLDEHSNCVECHADYASGDHVHPAVSLGCNSCHVVERRDAVTYVELKAAGSLVCRDCHAAEQLQHAHFPYASVMCVRCHNPHESANPRLLRAKVNDLCLGCHLYAKERASSSFVPLIELTSNKTIGHPTREHPVRGYPDPLRPEELSCTSCHLAHGGTQPHYLRMASEIPEDALNQSSDTYDMCRKCHLRLWGLEGIGAAKHRKKERY